MACGCGCSLACLPGLLLVLRLCSLWRDHWVRWSSMEKTVCVLSWLRLEAFSCSRNNRGSPSFRTAIISSFTYRTQTETLFWAIALFPLLNFTEKNYMNSFLWTMNSGSFPQSLNLYLSLLLLSASNQHIDQNMGQQIDGHFVIMLYDETTGVEHFASKFMSNLKHIKKWGWISLLGIFEAGKQVDVDLLYWWDILPTLQTSQRICFHGW